MPQVRVSRGPLDNLRVAVVTKHRALRGHLLREVDIAIATHAARLQREVSRGKVREG